MSDENLAHPELQVFIVGPARSGTSSLYFALANVFGLPGFGEGHFMPFLQRMIYSGRRYSEEFKFNTDDILFRRLMISDLESNIFQFVRDFYRSAHGGGSWIDKTPSSEAVHGVGLIKLIFPNAKVLCTKRNGLEVIKSRKIKFREEFDAACREWVGAMLGIRQHVIADPMNLVVDQVDLDVRQTETAEKICTWLGKRELCSALDDELSRNIVEASPNRHIHELRLRDMDWSENEKILFEQICGEQMRYFGYHY